MSDIGNKRDASSLSIQPPEDEIIDEPPRKRKLRKVRILKFVMKKTQNCKNN